MREALHRDQLTGNQGFVDVAEQTIGVGVDQRRAGRLPSVRT